jgi:hypothetical protein
VALTDRFGSLSSLGPESQLQLDASATKATSVAEKNRRE